MARFRRAVLEENLKTLPKELCMCDLDVKESDIFKKDIPAMKTAIGTKIIRFQPMTNIDFTGKFKKYFGTVTEEGYHVQYDNPDESVYDSWSPKEVFDAAYRDVSKGITFGDALFFLKQGKKIARAGWNGKGMWLMMVPEGLAETVSFQYEALKPAPWIGMKTVDQKFVPWLASQTDMLAEDWVIVDA